MERRVASLRGVGGPAGEGGATAEEGEKVAVSARARGLGPGEAGQPGREKVDTGALSGGGAASKVRVRPRSARDGRRAKGVCHRDKGAGAGGGGGRADRALRNRGGGRTGEGGPRWRLARPRPQHRGLRRRRAGPPKRASATSPGRRRRPCSGARRVSAGPGLAAPRAGQRKRLLEAATRAAKVGALMFMIGQQHNRALAR